MSAAAARARGRVRVSEISGGRHDVALWGLVHSLPLTTTSCHVHVAGTRTPFEALSYALREELPPGAPRVHAVVAATVAAVDGRVFYGETPS